MSDRNKSSVTEQTVLQDQAYLLWYVRINPSQAANPAPAPTCAASSQAASGVPDFDISADAKVVSLAQHANLQEAWMRVKEPEDMYVGEIWCHMLVSLSVA